MNGLPEKISKRLEGLWGTDVCRDYLLELITYRSENDRSKGFGLEILADLLHKLDEHDKHFPGLVPDTATELRGKVVFMTPVK